MDFAFIIIAGLTVLSAIAAITLRNLVHCALCLTLTFAGLAAAFLKLGAQFAGFAQILVYIGAVAILIVFAILLTRSREENKSIFAPGWWAGILIAALVFGILAAALRKSTVVLGIEPAAPSVTVRSIGDQLMGNYVVPLEVIGLLLTAALIGAAVIALHEKGPGTSIPPGEAQLPAKPAEPDNVVITQEPSQ